MKKIYGYICKAEVFTAALCFSISCVVIFIAAISRSFDRPINWSQDLSLFLFAWSVFLSADAAMRADKLVSVELLVNRFPHRWRNIAGTANYVIILVFLLVLLWFGVRLSYFTRTRVFQGIPGFSYTWVTLSIPVGALLQIITVSIKLKNFIGRFSPESASGDTPC